jgi:L-ascorbate metabolism protein UlaG (beta-lactamase superfamily)
MDAENPLVLEKLKGKVDVKWFGHAGFKIYFKDKNNVSRSIYIDIWIDNIDCPAEEKENIPTDADLILVTHGQPDHSTHCHFIAGMSKREDRKLVCNSEIAIYLMAQR